MRKISILRDGREALVFEGVQLASVDDRGMTYSGDTWWELALYKTSVGKYILASTFNLTHPTKRKMHSALCFSSAADLYSFMEKENHCQTATAQALLSQARDNDPAFSQAGINIIDTSHYTYTNEARRSPRLSAA